MVNGANFFSMYYRDRTLQTIPSPLFRASLGIAIATRDCHQSVGSAKKTQSAGVRKQATAVQSQREVQLWTHREHIPGLQCTLRKKTTVRMERRIKLAIVRTKLLLGRSGRTFKQKMFGRQKPGLPFRSCIEIVYPSLKLN